MEHVNFLNSTADWDKFEVRVLTFIVPQPVWQSGEAVDSALNNVYKCIK